MAERIETLYIAKGNHEQFIKSLTEEQKKYVKSTDKADKGSKKLISGLKGLAVAGIAAKALKAVVSETIKFEKEMSNVKALLKPTSAEFERLSATARELGKTTAFSAMQSAEAFAELGKLGFDTNQVIASSADVLNLAAAASTNMATAAEVTAKTINQYGLEAADAARVTDVIAKASSSSAVDIYNFQEAMKIAGATSKGMGTELEEATAAISALADGGIEGTMAGTGLSRVLLELGNSGSKISKVLRKVAPDAKTLTEKLNALKKENLSTTQIFDAFGKIAGKSALTLINNAEKVDNLTESYKNASGAAKEMADVQLDNLDGSLKLLKSASSELALTLGDTFSPALRASIDAATWSITAVAEAVVFWDKALDNAFDKVIGGNADAKGAFEGSAGSILKVTTAMEKLAEIQGRTTDFGRGSQYTEDGKKMALLREEIKNASGHSVELGKSIEDMKVGGRTVEQLTAQMERLAKASSDASQEKSITANEPEDDPTTPKAEVDNSKKIKALQERMKALKKLREITVSQMSVENQATQKIKDNYKDIANNATLTAEERKQVASAMSNDITALSEEQKAKQEEINRSLTTALLSEEDARVQGVKDKWSELLDGATTTAEQRVEVERTMQQEIEDVQNEFAERRQEAADLELEKDRERRATAFSYAESAQTAIVGLVNAGFTNKQNVMNAETKAEIMAVKKSTKTQDQKATAIAKIEDKAAKKSHELKLKEWRTSLLMSVANTALSITKTMSAIPMPAAMPFIAANVATGVASTATIASNKPRLALGSTNAFGESDVVGNRSGMGGTDSQLILVSPDEMIIKPKDVPTVQSVLNGNGEKQQAPQQTIQNISNYHISNQSLDPRTSSELVMESIYEAQRNNAVDKTQVNIGVE